MKTIDARGHKCPKPLMMVKEVLNQMSDGEEALAILGSSNARNNVEKMLSDHHITFSTEEKESAYFVQIKKSLNTSEIQNETSYCKEESCKK